VFAIGSSVGKNIIQQTLKNIKRFNFQMSHLPVFIIVMWINANKPLSATEKMPAATNSHDLLSDTRDKDFSARLGKTK
jgi:hypothetical protein